jgi:hypothetical protein
MENSVINNIAEQLKRSGNGDLAKKWNKLAQEAGDFSYPSYSPNPNIENFARITGDEQPKEPQQHTCTVTFTAPDGTTEAQMMDYIMGISGAMPGVKVNGFRWSVK